MYRTECRSNLWSDLGTQLRSQEDAETFRSGKGKGSAAPPTGHSIHVRSRLRNGSFLVQPCCLGTANHLLWITRGTAAGLWGPVISPSTHSLRAVNCLHLPCNVCKPTVGHSNEKVQPTISRLGWAKWAKAIKRETHSYKINKSWGVTVMTIVNNAVRVFQSC